MWLFELGDAFLSAFKKTGMDRRAGAEAEANRGQVRRGRANRGSWIDKTIPYEHRLQEQEPVKVKLKMIDMTAQQAFALH